MVHKPSLEPVSRAALTRKCCWKRGKFVDFRIETFRLCVVKLTSIELFRHSLPVRELECAPNPI